MGRQIWSWPFHIHKWSEGYLSAYGDSNLWHRHCTVEGCPARQTRAGRVGNWPSKNEKEKG